MRHVSFAPHPVRGLAALAGGTLSMIAETLSLLPVRCSGYVESELLRTPSSSRADTVPGGHRAAPGRASRPLRRAAGGHGQLGPCGLPRNLPGGPFGGRFPHDFHSLPRGLVARRHIHSKILPARRCHSPRDRYGIHLRPNTRGYRCPSRGMAGSSAPAARDLISDAAPYRNLKNS